MDEYIKREDAIKALCEGCNDRFSDEPCEPPDCEMRNAINSIRAADVAPKSEVEKLEHEIETLKDNNEHLAVMLEETKIELEAMRGAANSYKMHYENLARKIFMDIDRVVEKYSMGDIEHPAFVYIIAELKKKYTEGKE